MAHCHMRNLFNPAKYFKANTNGVFNTNVVFCHHFSESHEETLPYYWYEKMFPNLRRLACMLKNVDSVDGKLENINGDDSIIIDDRIRQKMHIFKSLARVFIGSPSIQKKLKEKCFKFELFSRASEREPIVVNSLTKVSSVLNISAQQRKVVRFTISPQVTQYRIWTGALEEILNGLKEEIDLLNHQCPSKGTKLGQQVISTCLKFLAQSAFSYESENSTSWMRPAPTKAVDSNASPKWEDVLEMFNDVIKYLEDEKDMLYHVGKLIVMREGLAPIKDVFVDNNMGYREVRHQETLVQKKLTKALGHSSRCMFTLLLYYLYGSVRDIEVDLCGGFYQKVCENQKKVMCLSMGKILTSDDERMVQRGIKQLDRGLGLFKFVWETAGMKEVLQLQGHLWCVGAEERSITYGGKTFFIHDLSLEGRAYS